MASVGRRDAALAAVQSPGDVGANRGQLLEQLAALYTDAGDVSNLDRTVAQLQAVRPNAAKTRYYAASARFMRGAFADALEQARLMIGADPTDADALNLAGDALASLGRSDEARQAFESALKSAPSDPAIYVNLGLLALGKGDGPRAEKFFAGALTLDPSFRSAREGLAQATNLRRQ